MATTRKWSSYGTPQLKKVLRNIRKSIEAGDETKYTPEDASDIYNILDKRGKTDSWMIDFVFSFTNPDASEEELAEEESTEVPTEDQSTDDQSTEEADQEEEEIYYPHLESAIQQEPTEEEEEELGQEESTEEAQVEKSKEQRRRYDRVGVKFDNTRPIQKGDIVEFQGSAKLGKQIVQGKVVGFSKGAHEDQRYCQITVEYDGKKVRCCKRDYACKLIEGQDVDVEVPTASEEE
jgi:hypothetical protein